MSINKETPSAPQDDFVSATGYPVFARSYSRRLEGESNRRETRIEALDRSLGAMVKIGRLTPQESQAIRSQALQSRVFPSGRWMWVGGTGWVEQPENYAGAYNCSSTEVCDTAAFGLLMDLAMTGCGTGAVLESRCIDRLPPIRNQISVSVVGQFGDQDPGNPDTIFVASDDGDHVTIQVGDSRKGWVSAYQGLIELAMDDRLVSDLSVTVDISHVRPMGRPLKGFGGVANPSKLPELFPRVARILNGALGRKLNAEECCLLIDEAAIVVVSGNIRRCLPEDALVHTANGLVPIKDVQVGDFVQTPIGLRRVTNKFDQGIQQVYRIEVVGDRPGPRATLNHRMAVISAIDHVDSRLWVELDYLWVKVSDLQSGDRLLTPEFELIEVIGVGDAVPMQTYDIEVEKAHCFYADGYLTHNSAGIRQFDASAPLLKDNLWVEVDGKWRIDPDRDALRAANHTRVYHEKPGEAECIEAVRKQFRSGEGAIQYAPEAIARASGDLLNTDALRRKFLDAYSSSGGRLAATEFLMSVLPEMSEQELNDRLHRYGFNPCFGAGTNILTRDEHGFPTHSPIESLIGKTVEVFDGLQWVEINNFRVTGHDQPMIRVILGCGESVRTTLYHDFILEDGTRRQAKDLVVGDRLLHVPDEDDNDVSWMFTVKSIAPDGVDTEVYCCTVPTTHQITLECGLITGQCGEIVMSNNFCNLAEVHLNQIDPLDIQGQIEAFKAAALLAAPLLHHDLSQVDARYQYSRSIDPIVGVSFTGLFDFFVQAFGVDWLRWWEAGRPEEWKPAQDNLALWSATNCFPEEPGNIYKRIERWYLATWNAVVHKATWDYCDRHGLRRPNRCTTVQPAGSKSLLTGASPGWHPPKAARFIRRIPFAKNDPIALACLDYGYSVVPSQSDKDENGDLLTDPFDPRCTEWLVEIPVAVSWADLPGADTIAIERFSALAQFDFYMQVQSHYTTHNCFARNTQFLTSEGVKTFESFEVGDTVTVLNADGDWVPATVVNTADERPMLAITVREGRTGKEKTITSTPCHRFPVRRPSGGKNKIKVVQAKDLKIGHRLVLNSADLPDLDEDGIRHGIVFGDGSLRKNKPNPGECLKARLYLCGDKRHLQSHFEGCDIHQRDDIDQTLIRGLPSKWKCLPSNDCSQSYVAGFIAGFLAADGNISGFTISICTGRQAVVDWIRDQSPRIGVRVTGVQWLERDGCGAFQIRFSRPTFPENMVLRHHHMEHFRRSHTSRPRQWRIIDIQDAAPQVGWCVMEPVTNHFTLSDNILVMNTSATIELREHEIEPLGRRIHQAIQDDEGYISAALLARYDNLQTFPRLPFEPISRETYEQLSMNMVMRRKPGTFAEHLARHDGATGGAIEAAEQGPGACDSDRCLMPQSK